MRIPVVRIALCAVLSVSAAGPVMEVSGQAPGQGPTGTGTQSDASPMQRLEVMRSRLDAMRRSLNSAVAAFGASDSGQKDGKQKQEEQKAAADDPRARLRGLEKEVGSLLSEVNEVRAKQERAERYDAGMLGKLETAVGELDGRVQTTLQATAGERRSGGAAVATSSTGKKKRGFFGRILGRGDDEYEELANTVAPGRDRELFMEAATQARKSNYEVARYLFGTIINTYPDSQYLPLSKLAVADTFYREGTTSALIQANASYRDWLTFFPTDPLADDVMLKMAEAEMRQMGLADRDISHATKAEQQLKVLLQQFPRTSLRPEVDIRLREVQENLAMHHLYIARFYYDRNQQEKGGLKGAQSRLRDIVQKYPNFSYMDETLYLLGATYVQEEEPDEAAKYFQQIIRSHPNSQYAEKAREQLDTIGAPKPEIDPQKAKEPPPVRPSLSQKIFREVLGTTPVTVSTDGVLISRNNKGGDLIEEAIRNGGQLMPTTTPTAPVYRRPPARQVVPPTTPPASSGQAVTTNAPSQSDGGSSSITAQPTQPGLPSGGSNPTRPETNPAAAIPLSTAPSTGPAVASPSVPKP